MKRSILHLAIGFCAVSCTVGAMMVDIPLPAIILQSDLIIIGHATGEKNEGEMTLTLPDNETPAKRWYRQSEVMVDEVLLDRAGIFRETETKPAVITVTTMARKPAPPPPQIQNGDGLVMVQPAVIADGPMYIELGKDDKFILVLRRLPEAEGYYLPAYPKNIVRVQAAGDQPEGERIRELADMDNWAWGKPVNGLQLTWAPSMTRILQFSGRRDRGKGPAYKFARLQFIAAVRNVRDSDIVLPHYGRDHFLQFYKVSRDREHVSLEINQNLNLQEKPFGPGDVTVLKPGEIIILARYGEGVYGDHIELELPVGEHWLAAELVLDREGETEDGLAYWQGTAYSKPLKIDIVPRNAARSNP